MIVVSKVLAESSRQADKVEYVTLTCMEAGATPLLQMFDYTLRAEEMHQKGKFLGKEVTIQVENIRDVFSNRAQFSGRIVSVK